mmetsp:Transcript_1643/g.3485  ORF Transcript_1643/g.3485 Transcript_1643/m.3485 type:complete len:242 (-) Transcript_1643:578-1303(-)
MPHPIRLQKVHLGHRVGQLGSAPSVVDGCRVWHFVQFVHNLLKVRQRLVHKDSFSKRRAKAQQTIPVALQKLYKNLLRALDRDHEERVAIKRKPLVQNKILRALHVKREVINHAGHLCVVQQHSKRHRPHRLNKKRVALHLLVIHRRPENALQAGVIRIHKLHLFVMLLPGHAIQKPAPPLNELLEVLRVGLHAHAVPTERSFKVERVAKVERQVRRELKVRSVSLSGQKSPDEELSLASL